MSKGGDDLDTTTVSDALDRLGIGGQTRGIHPLSPGLTVRGPAFTVRLVPTGGRDGTVGEFIDHVEPGAVVVLDNGGREDASVWGDLLALRAGLRGIAGTVIHGVCRDASRIISSGYPVFSRGSHMRTGKDRVRAEALGETVSLGTASVAPGDLVIGDADGVVVVPKSHVEAVLKAAREIHDAEERIRGALRAGVTMAEARASEGYHKLQRGDRTPGGHRSHAPSRTGPL